MATANTTSTNTSATSPTLRYAHNTLRSTTGGSHGRRLHQTGPIALPSQQLHSSSTLPLTPPPDTPSFDDKFASLNSLTLGGDRDFPREQLLREREDAMRRPPMRSRGESDLGRPQTKVQIPKFQPGSMPIPEVVEQRSRQLPSVIEIATGILIPLPFLFASLGFPIKREAVTHNALLIEDLKDFSNRPEHITSHPKHIFDPNFPFIETCLIAGLTLLIVGGVGFATSGAASTPPPSATTEEDSRFSAYTVRRIVTKALGAALPFYGALQLGGGRAALVMLLAIAIGTPSLLGQALGTTGLSVASVLKNRQYTLGWLALLVVSDIFGLSTSANHPHELILGYITLIISAFILPPPLSLKGWQARHSSPSSKSTSAVPTTPWSETPPVTPQLGGGQSDDTQERAYRDHREDNRPSMMAGAFLVLLSFLLAVVKGQSLQSVLKSAGHEVLFRVLALASSAALVLFARPASLYTHAKFGVLAGCATVALTGAFYTLQSYQIPILYAIWSALAYVALLFDSNRRSNARTAHGTHSHASGEHSKFTGYLLAMTEPGTMLHSILSDKSSRRIAYFASLNLAFMTVQFSYGLATGSLGLLTDSIHMLFDCAGLAVGLAASIMSKWPPSVNFPYGYGKVETLSGFANGILLILVCVEIVFDAIHRLTEGAELTRLNELLVVSTLGCIVNLLGLLAFGHAHHGHDHDHSHAHSHSEHSHTHSHSHIDEKSHHHGHHHHDSMNGHAIHTHTHSLSNGGLIDAPPTTKTPITPHPQSHSHENDNMRGIFLHVLADTLGSVAVIVSTLLIKWNGWAGWDPIASVIVSIMIFVSALPLVTGSARKLLLSLPDEEAYRLREVLLGMGELKGVAGYAGVRFWTGEGSSAFSPEDAHDQHDMGHQHGLGVISEKDVSELQRAAIHGTIHVMAARTADFDDVRSRTEEYLRRHGIDAVVQVEREGGGRCWCGGGLKVGG